MSQVLFNQLAYVGKLEASGFDARQARGAAEALGDAFTQAVATKSDISELRSELKGVEASLKTDIANLKTDMAKSETKIIIWLVSLIIPGIPIGAALAAFVFKHL